MVKAIDPSDIPPHKNPIPAAAISSYSITSLAYNENISVTL